MINRLTLTGLLALGFATTGCGGTKPHEPRPVECRGSSTIAYVPEPEPELMTTQQRVRNQAHDAYDREHYIQQARADNAVVKTRDSVPLKGAKGAAVLINMKRGQLHVTGGGTSNLVDTDFEFTTVEPVPILAYQMRGDTRVVDLLGMGKDEAWDLTLSERVPMAVRAEVAGGTREFNFEDVALTEFSLQSMGGPSIVSLAGDQPYLSSCEIHSRQGSISFSADGAYKDWVNGAIMTCQGDLAASFKGFYNRLSRLDLGSRCGDVDIDLTGCWQKTPRIHIVATCGNLRLKLPAGLGCTVKIHHSCASICAVGMHKTWSSEAWVNPAFGKTEAFLDITIEATCGQIDLILDPCCCPPWVW